MAEPVSVGVALPYSSPPAQFARLAESLGYDRLTYGEHLLFRRPILNAFVALAAAAGGTERIKLLSALTLLPLYPAALATKLVSSLAVVSDGRFEFGVGVGGEVPEEFKAVDSDLGTRGRRTDESLRIIDELLTGRPSDGPQLGHAFHNWSELMQPKPTESIPIWIGGRSDAAIRRAARFGDVWLPYLVSPDQLAAGATRLKELSHDRSRTVKTAVTCFVHLDDDPVQARHSAEDFVARLYDLHPAQVSKYVVAGTAEEVTSRLREFVDAGAHSVTLNFCAEGDAVDAMTRRASDQVLPKLRATS